MTFYITVASTLCSNFWIVFVDQLCLVMLRVSRDPESLFKYIFESENIQQSHHFERTMNKTPIKKQYIFNPGPLHQSMYLKFRIFRDVRWSFEICAPPVEFYDLICFPVSIPVCPTIYSETLTRIAPHTHTQLYTQSSGHIKIIKHSDLPHTETHTHTHTHTLADACTDTTRTYAFLQTRIHLHTLPSLHRCLCANTPPHGLQLQNVRRHLFEPDDSLSSLHSFANTDLWLNKAHIDSDFPAVVSLSLSLISRISLLFSSLFSFLFSLFSFLFSLFSFLFSLCLSFSFLFSLFSFPLFSFLFSLFSFSRFSFLVSRFSFLVSRFSFLVSRLSFLVSRLSPLVSRLASRVSRLASRVSRLASRVSRLASRVSRLASRVSRLASRVSVWLSLSWPRLLTATCSHATTHRHTKNIWSGVKKLALSSAL